MHDDNDGVMKKEKIVREELNKFSNKKIIWSALLQKLVNRVDHYMHASHDNK